MAETSISERIQPLLERLKGGDETAGRELIALTYERFRSLAAKILRSNYTRLKKWEETDDVIQDAAMRLWKSLEEFNAPTYRAVRLFIRFVE